MVSTVATPRPTLAGAVAAPVDGSRECDHGEYSGDSETNPGRGRGCIPVDGSCEGDHGEYSGDPETNPGWSRGCTC